MHSGSVRAIRLSISLVCYLLAGAFAVAQASAAQRPDAREMVAKFEDYIKAAVQHDKFSGSVLVAHDGAPVFSKSYGMANYELNVPNTSETVFRIASLTKQFTAMAILQLQDRGKLDVGDPICKHLNDCPAAWKPITVRHLLTHTSGIPNYSSLPYWDELLALKSYEHADLVALFRDLPLQFMPGEEFSYTNSGYYLLGLMIERLSGKTYGQYLHDEIFAPLGMTHSGYDRTRLLVPNRATGYYSLGTSFINAPFVSPTVPFASGGIHSTVGDLLRWDQALYSENLVSRKSLDEMFTPFRNNYGYGVQLGERFGRQKADHAGSFNGFSTYMVRYPADRLTVIVLSNSDRASAGRLGVMLSAIYFGEAYELPVAPLGDVLWDAIAQQGIEPAIRRYHDLKRTQADAYDFGEETLVDLGYELLEARNVAEALAIFELNLDMYPESAYSYDGLADVAVIKGDRQTAIAYFEKSLKLDPENEYAIEALARLRK